MRDLLSQDIYVHKDLTDRVALLNATLPKAVKVRPPSLLPSLPLFWGQYTSSKRTRKIHRLTPLFLPPSLPLSLLKVDEIYTKLRKEKRTATAEEQKLINEVEAAREIIIQVKNILGFFPPFFLLPFLPSFPFFLPPFPRSFLPPSLRTARPSVVCAKDKSLMLPSLPFSLLPSG